jgi:hypothetical protein
MEPTDAISLAHLLRAGSERPRGRPADQCDEVPPPHWITPLAQSGDMHSN